MLQDLLRGRTDRVVEWLASGGDPRASAPDGAPLIVWCAYYGDVTAVRFLLDRGESLATLGPDLGLNGAAFHGHWRLVEFLLERGADPNFADSDTGETPLHSALTKRNRAAGEAAAEVLLRAGADPNRRTVPGRDTGAFLRDARTRGETPLHRAAAFATPRTIRILVEAGADREARDAHGDTPLSWASWALRTAEVVDLLCYPPHRIRPEAVRKSVGREGPVGDAPWELGEP
ncbi:MAG: ankyrin repeat domain-containing protein [Fimbriimonadaceae bacterium]